MMYCLILSRPAWSLIRSYEIIRLRSARFTPTAPPGAIVGTTTAWYASNQEVLPLNCAAEILGSQPGTVMTELKAARVSFAVLVASANQSIETTATSSELDSQIPYSYQPDLLKRWIVHVPFGLSHEEAAAAPPWRR